MTPRRFCIRPHDDRGTSLVLALVFITIGSLVVMTALALADTSMRTTLALRSQVVENAAAEGAANIAINDLREGTYGGDGNCFGLSPELSVPSSVFQASLGVVSASVACQPDTGIDEFPLGTPAQAILANQTGTNADGLVVTDPFPGFSGVGGVRVAGNVFSRSRIHMLPDTNLTADGGTIRARGNCLRDSLLFGTFRATISPTPECPYAQDATCTKCVTPVIPALPVQVVPACQPIMTFTPGRYTDAVALNNRMTGSACPTNAIFHFTPGTYYFDFPPTTISVTLPIVGTIALSVPTTWRIDKGSLIAGTLARTITAGVPLQMPDACKSPVPTGAAGWVPPKPAEGVQFIFSGYSQMQISDNARVEICGAYAGTSAPQAIFALPTPLPPIAGVTCDLTILPCIVVQTGRVLSTIAPPVAAHIRGTVYAPTRDLAVRLGNDTVSTQRFNGGVALRRVFVTTTRAVGQAAVFTSPTADPFTVRRTFVRLEVKLCPGQLTCTNGAVRLRAKVQIRDSQPGGLPVAGAREITVLSWNLVH